MSVTFLLVKTGATHLRQSFVAQTLNSVSNEMDGTIQLLQSRIS